MYIVGKTKMLIGVALLFILLMAIAPFTIAKNNLGTLLKGKAFGAEPAWSPGCEYDKATDRDTDTYYDYKNGDGGYTGIDLGEEKTYRVSAISYFPRVGYEIRMVGGKFQGSVDGKTYVDLYTIEETPSPDWITVKVNNTTAFRYLRYLAPSEAYGNIAEVQFYTNDAVK